MLATRFQPRLQTATGSRAKAAGRTAVVRVVAFKNGDEQQTQKQELSKAKVTFQLPLHGEQLKRLPWHAAALQCAGAWQPLPLGIEGTVHAAIILP